MKSWALAVLALIGGMGLLCIGIVAFAEEPVESVPSNEIISIPVIVRPGLTVESCAADVVVMSSPLEACRYVSHTKRINTKTNRVTVTVRCINDPTENTP